MSIFDEENLIEITKDDITDATLSSSKIEDIYKKRAFANVLGARLGIKFLKSIGINADNFNSLYTIPAVLKDLDISDININNIKVDVRIVQDEEHLCIPKAHYIYNITPDIYIFMKLSPDFSVASFIGAIAPDEVNKSVENNDYYFISKTVLYNENSLKSALSKRKPESNVGISQNDIVKAESLIVNFIDGDIMNNEKHFVYEILKNSKELRDMFKDFEHFELISTDLAKTEEILSDSVLDVLGAQQLYKNDLSEGEFAANVNLDELADSTVADFVEDYIDDSKEVEMFDNQEIINDDFEEISNDTELNEIGELEELPSDEELAAFSTVNNFEENENVDEFEVLDLEDLSSTDLNNENIEGFEGFEGLDSSTSEISFEDLNDNTEDLLLQSEDATTDDFELVQDDADSFAVIDDVNLINSQENLEEISLENTEEFVLEETEGFVLDEPELQTINSNNEISIDNTDDSNSFELAENNEDVSFDDLSTDNEGFNLNEIENLTLEDDDDDFSLVDANPMDLSDTLDESPMSLMDSVQNEGMELIQDDAQPLETFGEVEELTLDNPQENQDLGGFDLDEVSELAPLNNETFQTLDDIAQNIDFDNVDANSLDVPDLEAFNEVEELEPLNMSEDVSGFNIDETDDVTETVGFEQPEELSQNLEESSATTNSDDEDDFSGIEEFTMDMASEVEKANPNLYNSQAPTDNYDPSQSFGNQIDNFNPSNGFTAAPEYQEEPVQNKPSSFDGFEGFPIEDNQGFDIPDSNSGFPIPDDTTVTNSASMNDINLDDLDDFDEDDDFGENTEPQSQNQNQNQNNAYSEEDFDFNEINLDDIDLNDPNLNIDNIDIELDDIDLNNISSLDDIPDVSQNEQYMQQDYNNEFAQGEMNMPQGDYVPDFNANDQNTIQALYENNPQNQIPGEAMNQSFNQNNVNYSMPPQQPAKKKSSPLLGILFIVLICAFGYTKKDLIMEKFNTNKGVTVSQDQNMPIEGETQEDKQDAELLNEDEAEEVNPEENVEKQPIGEIPGEAGGPQTVESMNESLKQNTVAKQTQPEVSKNLPPSFAKNPEPLSSNNVKRLYWEIPEDLSYNDAIVNFLKTAGRTMKFSMQSDLLNTTESPYLSKMIVDIVIKKDGTVENVTTTVSSGSKQIDTIVLQSVKAALKYVKAPTSEFKQDSYNFSLIINF